MNHPACQLCRGACCEELHFANMQDDFFTARAAVVTPQKLILEHRCPQLSGAGLCAIYDHRPAPCAVMPVGGSECRDIVARRRGADAARIVALLTHQPTAFTKETN